VIATRRVLVVEDEPTLRTVVAMILEDEGFTVETAGQGREALAKAQRRLPNLVITDLMMPIMSGWELIEAWRSDSATRHIPIVVVSAAYPATTAEALGVHAVLRKPFDIERLLAILQTLASEADGIGR
jgi:CheY-like chemotaxis protein